MSRGWLRSYPGSEILSHGTAALPSETAAFCQALEEMEKMQRVEDQPGRETFQGLDHLINPVRHEGESHDSQEGEDRPASDLPKFACDDPEAAEYGR